MMCQRKERKLIIIIIIIIISVLRQSLFLSILKRGLDVTNNYVGFHFGFGLWPLIFRVECPSNSVILYLIQGTKGGKHIEICFMCYCMKCKYFTRRLIITKNF